MIRFWNDIRRCDRCGTVGSISSYNDALIVQAMDTPPNGWTNVVIYANGHKKLYQFCSPKCNRKFFKKVKS